MPANKSHIIKTVCIDAAADTEESALAFSDKIKSVDFEKLLSKALHKYDDIAERVRIDSIILDIGNMNPLEIDFPDEELARKLEEALDKNIRLFNLNRNALNEKTSMSFSKNEKTQMEAVAAGIQAEALVYFLQYGALPWNICGKPDLKTALFELAKSDVFYVEQFILPLLRHERVIHRLNNLLNIHDITNLLKICKVNDIADAEMMIEFLMKQMADFNSPQFTNDLSFTLLQSWYLSTVKNEKVQILFSRSIKPLVEKLPVSILIKIKEQLPVVIPAFPIQESRDAFHYLLELVIERIQQEFFKDSVVINTDTKTGGGISANDENEIKNEKNDVPEPDSYFIENAGLVLLNTALLKRYFEVLGWTKDKNIIDEEARFKMILWTNYLAYGENKVYEYDFILSKILVGMHPSNVCDLNIRLSESEVKASNEYLNAIIEYWKGIKNTSIAGLRSSFLQRSGKLANEDGGWQLHVESKAYDILIESLPWSFSIIKLPWMQKPLFTQWKTRV